VGVADRGTLGQLPNENEVLGKGGDSSGISEGGGAACRAFEDEVDSDLVRPPSSARGVSSPPSTSPSPSTSRSSAPLELLPDDEAMALSAIPSSSYTGVRRCVGALDEADERAERGSCTVMDMDMLPGVGVAGGAGGGGRRFAS
jgi:hypothetical protein